MRKTAKQLALGLFAAVALSGCGSEKAAPQTEESTSKKKFDPMALELTEANLIQGREVWMKTCTGCHSTGLGEAPIIANKDAWSTRIAKGKETLYDHAINGFSGPLMLTMPPRGGNPSLTDEEVKAAVDFMVYASR